MIHYFDIDNIFLVWQQIGNGFIIHDDALLLNSKDEIEKLIKNSVSGLTIKKDELIYYQNLISKSNQNVNFIMIKINNETNNKIVKKSDKYLSSYRYYLK